MSAWREGVLHCRLHTSEEAHCAERGAGQSRPGHCKPVTEMYGISFVNGGRNDVSLLNAFILFVYSVIFYTQNMSSQKYIHHFREGLVMCIVILPCVILIVAEFRSVMRQNVTPADSATGVPVRLKLKDVNSIIWLVIYRNIWSFK